MGSQLSADQAEMPNLRVYLDGVHGVISVAQQASVERGSSGCLSCSGAGPRTGPDAVESICLHLAHYGSRHPRKRGRLFFFFFPFLIYILGNGQVHECLDAVQK